MRVLVATHEHQGSHPGDYCHTIDGELVTVVVARCADPVRCGCERGFAGLASARATTTAMVAELPHLDREQLRQAIDASLARQGWFTGLSEDEAAELVDSHLEAIELVARVFESGTILGRSGDQVWPRAELAA